MKPIFGYRYSDEDLNWVFKPGRGWVYEHGSKISVDEMKKIHERTRRQLIKLVKQAQK